MTCLFMLFQYLMMFLNLFDIILCFNIYMDWWIKILFWLINHVLKFLLMMLGCLKGVCVFDFDEFWNQSNIAVGVWWLFLCCLCMFLIPEFSLGLKVFKESVLDWILMFLLADKKTTVLKAEILYIFLIIRVYLLVFFCSNLFVYYNEVC